MIDAVPYPMTVALLAGVAHGYSGLGGGLLLVPPLTLAVGSVAA